MASLPIGLFVEFAAVDIYRAMRVTPTTFAILGIFAHYAAIRDASSRL